MYIKDIPYVIHNLISDFIINKNIPQIKKILKYKPNNLYFISFSMLDKTTYSSEQIDGSHENYIIYQIKSFINTHLIDEKKISSTKIIYNFDNDISYEIYISIERFIEKNEFIIVDEKESINNLKEERNKEKEQIKNITLKHKLCDIINNNPGIDLGKIIQKSRLIKNPDTRKQILKTLIDEEKIIMKFDTSQGGIRRIYKPL